MVLVVGQSVPVAEGLRVRMMDGMGQRGSGTISRVLDEEGEVVSVVWDDGQEEEQVPTGKDGEFHLSVAQAKTFTKFAPPSSSSSSVPRKSPPASFVATMPRGATAASDARPPAGRPSASHEPPPAPASSTPSSSSDGEVGRLGSAPGPGSRFEPTPPPGQGLASPYASQGGSEAARHPPSSSLDRAISAPGAEHAHQQSNLFSSQRVAGHATPPAAPPLYSSQGQRSASPYSSQIHSSARGAKDAPPSRQSQPPTSQPPPPPQPERPPRVERIPARTSLPASRMSVESAQAPSVGTDELHKQLLAQEVIKLRKEVQELRAGQQIRQKASVGNAQLLHTLEEQIGRLSRERDETVAKANAQKGLLAKEVKALRHDLMESQQSLEHNLEQQQLITYDPDSPVAQALAQRREYEENFTKSLREVRQALEKTSLKALSTESASPVGVRTLLQMSNERIDHALNAAKSVNVEERLHIECLRIAIENGKLRKGLNEYTEGLLQNVFVKQDVQSGHPNGLPNGAGTSSVKRQTAAKDGSLFGLFV